MTSTLNLTIDLHRIELHDRLADPFIINRVVNVICKHNNFSILSINTSILADNSTTLVTTDNGTITFVAFPSRNYAVFYLHSFACIEHKRLHEIYDFLISAFSAERAAEFINISESYYSPHSDPIPIPAPDEIRNVETTESW